jgi:hypothetical protein
MKLFEQSNLWKQGLAIRKGSDPEASAREILRTSFLQTREAVTPLVAQIHSELPDLTIHDITHLDSLWLIADVLMGDKYDINPAETFVLGITFLLHDAACTTFAYSNGINGLMDTTEWKDIVALNNLSQNSLTHGNRSYQIALFEVLRLLHPKQAEKLLTHNWPDLEGEDRYLMQNPDLRSYYGRDIGLIAASHGKDAAIAEQKWANAHPLTPHSCLLLSTEKIWNVDCLKIAMLLRCIDAAHIDSKRAPAMLASIRNPTGGSREHWLFQNRLGQASVNDKQEIYWTSGRNFEEKDSKAWWLCYETMKMIDHEIRVVNRILKNNGRQELFVKGVAGANDISIFLNNVQVQGWLPVDINFKIMDVGGVIEKFGGEKLYGQKPHLAIRELIQNAADAVRARRLYRDDSDLGRIDISLTFKGSDCWLNIQDNGIGMSEFVLTEVLLDFGRSLWRDANVREEWAGLAGKGFEAVGKFGVGFFSVFMLGDEVKVTTWRDGDAESKQRTLHLPHSTKSKPILLDTPEQDRLKEVGTRVSVRLREGRSSILKSLYPDRSHYYLIDRESREMTLGELIGVLAPALDIDVWCKDDQGAKVKVIEANDWKIMSPWNLLKRLSPASTDDHLSRCTRNFHDIIQDGELVGRASLEGSLFGWSSTDQGILVYKGLNMGRWSKCGLLLSNNNEDLARKVSKPICSQEALYIWASKIKDEMGGKINHHSSNMLLSLGLSPDDLPLLEINGEYLTGSQFKSYLIESKPKELVFLNEDPDCPESLSSNDFESLFEIHDSVLVDTFNSVDGREHFGIEDWIENLIPETDASPRTVVAAVHSYILQVWPNAKRVIEDRVVGKAGYKRVEAECMIYEP